MAKKTIILALLSVSLLSPIFAFAKVELEVDFPVFNNVDITEASSLAQVIKYFFDMALIIAVIAVTISLIYGGVSYLASTGVPGKMAQAKKRVTRAFLGLVIVAASFLLLRAVNPQLLVLQVEKRPVVSGVLLLNDKVFSNTEIMNILETAPTNQDEEEILAETLEKLLEAPDAQPKAVYLHQDVGDLTELFGELLVGAVENPFRVMISWERDSYDTRIVHNYLSPGWFYFKDFYLRGLYFLPGANVRVKAHHNPDFSIDKAGPGFFFTTMTEEEAEAEQPADEVFTYPQCSALAGGPCRFEMIEQGIKFLVSNSAGLSDARKTRKTVPLSIKIEGLDPGVYLYQIVKQNEGQPNERQLLAKQAYFEDNDRAPLLRSYPYEIDDKANKIEIRNFTYEKSADTGQVEKVDAGNYLAILHEDENFKGQLRLFFDRFSLKFSNPPASHPYNYNLLEDNPATPQTESEMVLADEPYLFGRVDKPSSIQIFQIEEEPESCEVILCAEIGLKDCYAYLLNLSSPSEEAQSSVSGEIVDFLADPFKFPIGPTILPPTIQVRRSPEDIPPNVTQPLDARVPLNGNVRSMKIIGNCLVVLFESQIQDFNKCRDALIKSEREDNCWTDGSPGSHSEVFFPWSKEHTVNGGYLDLTEDNKAYYHQTGRCGCSAKEVLGRLTWFDDCEPCARSIVILPIKR